MNTNKFIRNINFTFSITDTNKYYISKTCVYKNKYVFLSIVEQKKDYDLTDKHRLEYRDNPKYNVSNH